MTYEAVQEFGNAAVDVDVLYPVNLGAANGWSLFESVSYHVGVRSYHAVMIRWKQIMFEMIVSVSELTLLGIISLLLYLHQAISLVY